MHNGQSMDVYSQPKEFYATLLEGLSTFWHNTWNGCHYALTQQQYFVVDHIKCNGEAENKRLVEGEAIC